VIAPLVALAVALAYAQDSGGASTPPLTLHVATALDTSDAEQLAAWWTAHESEVGTKADVVRLPKLTSRDLEPDTLLLGYERGALDELAGDAAHEGALAPVDGGAVVPFARQSWTPAWRIGAATRGEVDSFASLWSDDWRGHVRIRRVTADSSEGLVLGELALTLDLLGSSVLPQLVLASDRDDALAPSSQSFDRLLEGLPAGTATIVPVRSAARARRAGLPVSWTKPKEGFVVLELGAALTRGSSRAAVDWFARRFASDVAPTLRRELELEPVGAPAADAPEWMRLVASASLPVDRAAAAAVRLRLAPLYDAPVGVAPSPEWGGVPAWIDATLLTIAAVVALVAWRKVGRDRGRDRRA
jgi:hypothetical protein